MTFSLHFPLLLFLVFVAPLRVFGQTAPAQTPETIFDRLALIDDPEVVLTTNLDTLFEKRNTEDYQLAHFAFADAAGVASNWEIEIRSRGRYRRRKCDFPPIKLKFENDQLEAEGLKKHNELKLVTHCLDDNEGEENLREEYLIYKLFEQLSPIHYRSKYVDITYRDTVNNRRIKSYAIILEDEKELAERMKSDLCEDCYGRVDTFFDNHHLQILTLYQYMIGNADWSVTLLRNVKLLKPDNGDKFLLAPYDFDFTGIVDASYARPDPTLGISNVTERKILGPLDAGQNLDEGIAFFKERRQQILDFVDEFPYLRNKEKKTIGRYIESFYDEIENINVTEVGSSN